MKKLIVVLSTVIFIFFVYLSFIFDINAYKSQIENLISKQANVDVKIGGNLQLDIGTSSFISAEDIIISKGSNKLIEADMFSSQISLANILLKKINIESFSFMNVKVYGINIDESLIKTYNAFAGRRYDIKEKGYSLIKKIDSFGFFNKQNLIIQNIIIETELLEMTGSGEINIKDNSLNIESISQVKNNNYIRDKYKKYYPKYLINSELPTYFTGSIENPKIDIQYSELIVTKLKEEIQNKALNSIKEKLKEKLDKDILNKLPF